MAAYAAPSGPAAAAWGRHCCSPLLLAPALTPHAAPAPATPPADAENDRTLRLRAAGRTVSSRDFASPARPRLLLAVANYVVDTLAQDAYRLRGGRLERAALSISAPRDADGSDPLTRVGEGDGAAAARLLASSRTVGRMTWQWRWAGVDAEAAGASLARSGHPLGSRVLETYCRLFGGAAFGGVGGARDATFLVPLGGLRLLDSLSLMAGGRCGVLLGDKAYSEEGELLGLRSPHIALHGSFSFMANLHGMILGAEALGGTGRSTPLRDGFKCVCLAVGLDGSGSGPARAAPGASGGGDDDRAGDGPTVVESAPADDGAASSALALQWGAWFSTYCPEAFSALQRAVYEHDPPATCSLRTALAVLRLSCWEPDVAYKFRATLVSRAETASPRLRRDLTADLVRCAGAAFPLQPNKDVLFELGRALVNIGRFGAATAFFEESRWWCGEHHVAWYNMGLCHHRAGRFGQAAACHRRSLELDGGYGLARDWLGNATKRARERRAVEGRLAADPALAARVGAAVEASREAARLRGWLDGEALVGDAAAARSAGPGAEAGAEARRLVSALGRPRRRAGTRARLRRARRAGPGPSPRRRQRSCPGRTGMVCRRR